MIQLEFTEAERHTLLELLESTLSDLRMEIADTDRLEYREMLKGRKAILRKLIESLRGAAQG